MDLFSLTRDEEQLEEQLGGLAMRFRGTRSDEERGNVAREYQNSDAFDPQWELA